MKVVLQRVKSAYVEVDSIKISEISQGLLIFWGIEEEDTDIPIIEKGKAYTGEVKFMTDGYTQTHIAEKDLDLSFKTDLAINPLDKGHIAFRTENLKDFKKHLDEMGIKYSDWGETAVMGWMQIFFYDPDGNIIEVHQKSNSENG